MGCAGGKHLVSATGDNTLRPSAVVSALDSIPNTDGVLKDLPDVVEKVLDTMKEGELKSTLFGNSDAESMSPVKEKIPATLETKLVKPVLETEIKSFKQNVIQNVGVPDNVSSSSKQSKPEDLEGLVKAYKKGSPTKSADIDSLRTSSPESEIEEALANSIDPNPPTPKPTFSELQQLAVDTIISSYVKNGDNTTNQEEEQSSLITNVKKFETITINPKDPTEWEKQADLLASLQKFNPIEAVRKMRKENGTSNGFAQRVGGGGGIGGGDLKPKVQRYFEDLNEFLPLQSPHRSRISSAKSDRSTKGFSSDTDNGQISKNKTETIQKLKLDVVDVKIIKKTPDVKRKETQLTPSRTKLTVSQNVRGIPSPGLYKVRERCAVCCNKYKQ